MVKIGTRALISIDGKLILATHWDGFPSSLGMELLHCDKTMEAVIKVAKRHTIDAAHRSIHADLNRERIKELAEKHRLTEEKIRNGVRRGNIIGAEDHEICSIDDYGDFAEYQYDIRGKKIYFRALKGWWPESLGKSPNFRRLIEKDVEKD